MVGLPGQVQYANVRENLGKVIPFKFCGTMDDTSPGHLDAVGPGYRESVRTLSSFIFLASVGTSHYILSWCVALPDHANLIHVWGKYLCYTHVHVLNFSGLLPLYRISGLALKMDLSHPKQSRHRT